MSRLPIDLPLTELTPRDLGLQIRPDGRISSVERGSWAHMTGLNPGDAIRRVGQIWVDTVSYDEMLILLRERPTTVQIALDVNPEEVERVAAKPCEALSSNVIAAEEQVKRKEIGGYKKGEFNPIAIAAGQVEGEDGGISPGAKYGFPMTRDGGGLDADTGGFIRLKFSDIDVSPNTRKILGMREGGEDGDGESGKNKLSVYKPRDSNAQSEKDFRSRLDHVSPQKMKKMMQSDGPDGELFPGRGKDRSAISPTGHYNPSSPGLSSGSPGASLPGGRLPPRHPDYDDPVVKTQLKDTALLLTAIRSVNPRNEHFLKYHAAQKSATLDKAVKLCFDDYNDLKMIIPRPEQLHPKRNTDEWITQPTGPPNKPGPPSFGQNGDWHNNEGKNGTSSAVTDAAFKTHVPEPEAGSTIFDNLGGVKYENLIGSEQLRPQVVRKSHLPVYDMDKETGKMYQGRFGSRPLYRNPEQKIVAAKFLYREKLKFPGGLDEFGNVIIKGDDQKGHDVNNGNNVQNGVQKAKKAAGAPTPALGSQFSQELQTSAAKLVAEMAGLAMPTEQFMEDVVGRSESEQVGMSLAERMAEALKSADNERVEEEGAFVDDFSRPVLYEDIRRKLREERGLSVDGEEEERKAGVLRTGDTDAGADTDTVEKDKVNSMENNMENGENKVVRREQDGGEEAGTIRDREGQQREAQIFGGVEADGYGDHLYAKFPR